MNHLNTYSIASLYAAFSPDEAKRMADRLDIHYAPKHGSWMNMVEISVLTHQCLSRYSSAKKQIVPPGATVAIYLMLLIAGSSLLLMKELN